MGRNLLSIALSLSLVLVLCNAKKTAFPVNDTELPMLPFAPDSTSEQKSTKNEDYRVQMHKLFEKDSSATQAYNKFRKAIPDAHKKGTLEILFREFTSAPAFTINKKDKSDSLQKIQRQWVKDALSEKDETIRELYSRYIQFLHNHSNNYQYYFLERSQIRPGEELRLHTSGNYMKNKPNSIESKIEIAQLSFDKHLKPEGFIVERTDSARLVDYSDVYGQKMEKPGVFRITVYNNLHFQQFYFQVSWLDCVVKFDPSKLLLFASSYKDTIPPPYNVHIMNSSGQIYTTKTDSNGICAMRHKFTNVPNQLQGLKLIVEKDEQLAFLTGSMPYIQNDTTIEYYIYTDRPVYRPGNRVHFRGLIKLLTNSNMLSSTNFDSIDLLITDPQYNKLWHDTIPIDSFGQFGDSLDLGEEASQGRYMIQFQGIRNNDPKKRIYNSNRYSNASFLVDSYKKPEFEISITPSKEVYLISEQAELKVHGQYYFGGPLSNVPVKIRWYRQDFYHFFGNAKKHGFQFFPQGNREFIREENSSLDNQGNLILTWKQDQGKERESGYLIAEVIATDQSRREVRGEGKLQIIKYDAYLSVIPDKYQYEIGETANLEIVAVTMKGQALQGKLNIRVKKDNEIISDESITIHPSGRNRFKLAVNEHGAYTIEISAKDHTGKTAYTEANIQVVKKRIWDWNWERIEINPDKQEYTIGDTARISVKTGADSTKTLCTVEGQKINAYNVIRLEDHSLEYIIPITKQIGCNALVSIVFSGQTGMASSAVNLKITDSTTMLKVKLAGNKTLKPGADFNGTITVTDLNGKPVTSRFSVALVDESISDVAALLETAGVYGHYFYGRKESQKSILNIFPSYYSNIVSTSFNEFSPAFLGVLSTISTEKPTLKRELNETRFSKEIGYGSGFASDNAMALAAPEMASGEPKSRKGLSKVNVQDGSTTPPPERKEFKDLGYWNPSITTDENGTAPLSFKMPDDLTRWRMVIIGSDNASYLIDFSDTLITRQDIMVKLECPRGFVVNDSAIITAVVHNYSDKNADLKVSFSANDGKENIEIVNKSSKKLQLASGETKRLDWPVKILKNGNVALSVSATSPAGSDAETRAYPVRFHGIKRSLTFAGVLSDKVQQDTINIPAIKDAQTSSRVLTIDYSPTLVYSLFESLDYLTGYPYGCVEQTISRFLPNLYVASVMKRLDMHNDSLQQNIPKYTHAGIERLQKLQHSDGGWGWWEGDESDPRMTSLVLNALDYAIDSDIPESDKIIARSMYNSGITSALYQLKKSKELTKSILLVHALKNKNASKVSPAVMDIYSQRGKLSSYELALLLDCLLTINKQDEAKKIVELIETKAVKASNSIYWNGNSQYSWYSQDEETTARVIKSLIKYDPEHSLLTGAVAWVSRVKHNGYWVSTKTTAAVIEALSLYLEKTSEFAPDYIGKIMLNDKELTTFTINKDSLKNWKGHLVLPDSILENQNTIQISISGKGRLYYSANIRYISDENPIRSRDSGLEVKRTYTKLVYTSDKNGDWKVKRIPFDGKLKSGDEIEVSVTLKGNQNYEHVMLEDFFPSGMHILHKEKNWYSRWCGGWWWGYTHNEPKDDRMVFFINKMSSEERTFNYLLRAETPGTFVGLPARAELMYSPDVNGNSEEISVQISD